MADRYLDGHMDRPCPRCEGSAGRILCPVLDRPRDTPPPGPDDLVACVRCGYLGHAPCPLIGA